MTRSWPLLVTAVTALSLAGCGDENSSVNPVNQPGSDAGVDAPADAPVEAGMDASEDGPSEADAPWDPRFNALAASIDQERKEMGAPGAAFACIEGGKVVFAAGFGTKDPHGSDPVLPTTLFRIGSVTKVLTATAALQQVQAGKLDLDAPVTDVVPNYQFALDDTWADSILLRYALDHTAGQFDALAFSGSDDAALESGLYAYANEYYLMSPPGRFWNYSNPNFSLAGLLVEKASGRWYREAMAQDLFAPLGMNRTFFLGSEVLADGDYASGLTTDWNTGEGGAIAAPDSYDSAFGRPAGFAYSNVYDMAAFVAFLMHGNPAVLSDTLRAELAKPHVDTRILGDAEWYGYGLFHYNGFSLNDGYHDLPLISHGGDIAGFAADIYYVPDLDVGVVAFASTDGAHFNKSIAMALTLIPNMPAPSGSPPDITFDPTTLPDFVGTYHDPIYAGDLIVTIEGGVLTVSAPEADAAGIVYGKTPKPYAPDGFLLEVDGTLTPLTFIRDAQGNVEYARTRQFVWKAESSVDSLPHPPLATPAQLRRAVADVARHPFHRPSLVFPPR